MAALIAWCTSLPCWSRCARLIRPRLPDVVTQFLQTSASIQPWLCTDGVTGTRIQPAAGSVAMEPKGDGREIQGGHIADPRSAGLVGPPDPWGVGRSSSDEVQPLPARRGRRPYTDGICELG